MRSILLFVFLMFSSTALWAEENKITQITDVTNRYVGAEILKVEFSSTFNAKRAIAAVELFLKANGDSKVERIQFYHLSPRAAVVMCRCKETTEMGMAGILKAIHLERSGGLTASFSRNEGAHLATEKNQQYWESLKKLHQYCGGKGLLKEKSRADDGTWIHYGSK